MRKYYYLLLLLVCYNCISVNRIAHNYKHAIRVFPTVSKGDTINHIKSLIIYVESAPDTICSDSTFCLTVVFKNVTDNSVTFYPNSSLRIIRLTGGIHSPWYIIQEQSDLALECKLSAQEMYKETYYVKAIPPTFTKGNHHLRVFYLRTKKDDQTEESGLYGALESETFHVFVK